MTTYTIDSENNITAHGSKQEAGEGDIFSTQQELAYVAATWPATRLVEEFPRQRFVLDHIAKPAIADGKMELWQTGLRRLAQAPNLYCKLSGMVTEARWKGWQTGDFHPYLDVVFEAFGPGRLMIGSDWPVCTLSASYESAMGIVMDYIAQLPTAEQDAILDENCRRFYRLPA